MPERRRPYVLVTAEHAGNRVPARWRAALRGAGRALDSHRGFDAGSLAMARVLARRLRAPLIPAATTRLLVDLNREEGSPQLFSEWTRRLPAPERERLLATLYRPHRDLVRQAIARARHHGRGVVHVASHSFVPVLRGRRRALDVGLLFDPGRAWERSLARAWRAALCTLEPGLRVRFNRPYRGTSDGLTRSLRALHAGAVYAGLELELNQALLGLAAARLRRLRSAIAESLRQALAEQP